MSELSPKLRNSELVEAMERELSFWPGVTHGYEPRRGGHWQCNLYYQGRSRFVVFSGSPSDYRAVRNAARDVRRELVRLGAVRDADNSQPRPSGPHRPPPPPREIKPPTGLLGEMRPDAFAPLRDLLYSQVRQLGLRWAHLEVPPERLDEGAQALIASWHPDLIRRACDLIIKAEKRE